jgi:hypothetical protein
MNSPASNESRAKRSSATALTGTALTGTALTGASLSDAATVAVVIDRSKLLSKGGRWTVGVLALVLLALIAYLFLAGRTITYEALDSSVTTFVVRCAPLVGFLDDSHYSTELTSDDITVLDFHIVRGPAAQKDAAYRAIETACNQRQTTDAALLAILATPLAVSTLLALGDIPLPGRRGAWRSNDTAEQQ